MKLICLVLVLLPVISLAQLKGTWMTYDQSGTGLKVEITEDYLVKYSYGYTDDPDHSSWRPYDSIPIYKFENDVLVIKNKKGGDGYSAAAISFKSEGNVLQMAQIMKGFKTIKTAVKEAKEYKYKALITKEYYTLKYFSELENYKTLDQITKSDFIVVANRLNAYDRDMEGFLADTGERAQRMTFYITQGIVNRTLLELGYNPFKPYEGGWYLKKLMEDEEIKALLEKQVHLRLN